MTIAKNNIIPPRKGKRSAKGLAKDLGKLIGREKVKTDSEDCFSYASDATKFFAWSMPDAVVLPDTAEDVSKVLKYASKKNVPVTPRGAGSGLSAGCTPIEGGIVLDMKRMRRIIEINRGNMTARVESGVVLDHFHKAVEKQKMFYPPDPQSMEVCTIGGNVATRAGGPHGVKYGTTSNYVLGLEMVLPDGEIINTGGVCVKQSAGYDLTHLMTGSEGTLGAITKINLRLLPLPPARRTLVAICESADQAGSLVSEIIAEGAVPAKLELLSKGSVMVMNKFISPQLSFEGEAYLLMELDGAPAQIEEESKRIRQISDKMNILELRDIEDEKEAETYWIARKNLYPSALMIFKRLISEDVTVPRDRIPEFVSAIHEIAASSPGLFISLGGHAGDGNMHPAIGFPEITEELEKMADTATEQIVKKGLELGGTISGEHGIGLHKAEFIEQEMGRAQIELFKRIKKAFDPKGIMNPGKIWLNGGEK